MYRGTFLNSLEFGKHFMNRQNIIFIQILISNITTNVIFNLKTTIDIYEVLLLGLGLAGVALFDSAGESN